MSDPKVIWDGEDIAFLKARAVDNPRRRCRLCAHPGTDHPIHEMLIIHGRDAYVRPHRHLGQAESFQIIEGRATAVFFEEHGGISGWSTMTASADGGAFYYRMPEDTFHTILIESEWLVFHECTQGPFDPARCEFAPWAPDDHDDGQVQAYMEELKSALGSAA
ncbi:MAG: WbuC family cupin fold metalloprotein [Rhodospirillales bacterium]